MIPYEYKTYRLMVLPHSTWVDTGCDDDDDGDDDDTMVMTVIIMMMMRMMMMRRRRGRMIVSVEQRPGWTEHGTC